MDKFIATVAGLGILAIILWRGARGFKRAKALDAIKKAARDAEYAKEVAAKENSELTYDELRDRYRKRV